MMGNGEETLLSVIKDVSAKINKLDVLEQRIIDMNATVNKLSEHQEIIIRDFNERWNRLPDTYLSRGEYERKGVTNKMSALQRDFAEFKVEANKMVSDAILRARDDDQSNHRETSGWVWGLFMFIASFLSSALFFALGHIFH